MSQNSKEPKILCLTGKGKLKLCIGRKRKAQTMYWHKNPTYVCKFCGKCKIICKTSLPTREVKIFEVKIGDVKISVALGRGVFSSVAARKLL